MIDDEARDQRRDTPSPGSAKSETDGLPARGGRS